MLDDRIAKLREDARNRGVYVYARDIARNLGVCVPKNHGNWWKYSNGKLHIDYDDYGPNLSITFDGIAVFSYQLGKILRYRPDVDFWIKNLTNIYEKLVKPLLDEKDAEEAKAEAKNILEDWESKWRSKMW